jgi:carbonic anhydrase
MQTIELSPTQIEAFAKRMYENNRPTQPLHGRVVRSVSIQSAESNNTGP